MTHWISHYVSGLDPYDVVPAADLTPADLEDNGEVRQALAESHGRVYMVTWRRDEYAGPPDWDVLTPHVYLDRGYIGHDDVADVVDDIRRAWRDASSIDVFTRYLRLVHGASAVAVAGYLGDGNGPGMVCFDTPAWRERVGAEPWDGDPATDPAAQTLAVWRALYDGDVYGIVVDRIDPHDGVVHVTSCWGMYETGDDAELSHALTDIAVPEIIADAECLGRPGVEITVVVSADDAETHWDSRDDVAASVRATVQEIIAGDGTPVAPSEIRVRD